MRASNAEREHGYAMVALLVGLAVMAVLLAVAMPVWRTLIQREHEDELIFRGEQYVRAVMLFQRKFANAYPPNLDLLVEQRFLRRKYKDPVNKDAEFQLIYQSQLLPGTGRGGVQVPGGGGGGTATPGAAGQPSTGAGSQAGTPGQTSQQALQAGGTSAGGAGPSGGIVGVASKSTQKSMRIYNGRSVYNEWQFIWTPQGGRGGPAGTIGPGGRGGGRGGPGGGRGGPGGGAPGGPGPIGPGIRPPG